MRWFVCGYIMGHLGADMSGDAQVVASIAGNLGVSADDAEGMERVMAYASHYGAWKWCFFIPAGIAVLGALWLFAGLRDDPAVGGTPRASGYRDRQGRKQEQEK